jgi:hypothetical protein
MRPATSFNGRALWTRMLRFEESNRSDGGKGVISDAFYRTESERDGRESKGEWRPVVSGSLLISLRVGAGKRRDRGDGRAVTPLLWSRGGVEGGR